MKNDIIYVSPKELYPTESMFSISNKKLQACIEILKEEKDSLVVTVFSFENVLYILEGHHIVLASILINLDKINVQMVNRNEIAFWNKEENVRNHLKNVGMSTLYDFETIGNFKYGFYPEYYKR